MVESPARRTTPPPADADAGELPTGPSLEEARESLSYWEKRLDELPIYERGKRREARGMVERWRGRVEVAERERSGPGPLEELFAALGLRGLRTRTIFTGLKVAAVLLIVIVLALVALVILFWPELEPLAREAVRQGGG